MARSRIIIGFRGLTASLIYLGSSGSEAEAAMTSAAHVDRFEILEGPGRRKNNPRFDPASKVVVAAPTSEPEPFVIPAEIKGLKKEELAHALMGCKGHIEQLEQRVRDLQEQAQEPQPPRWMQEPTEETPPPVADENTPELDLDKQE